MATQLVDKLRGGPSVRLSLATGVVGTLIIGLIGVAGPYFKQATAIQQPGAGPQFVAVRSLPPARTVAAAPLLAAIDDRGFVDSFARCESPQRLAALGRTHDSAVAICTATDGQYVYNGIRLSSETTLSLRSVTMTQNGFEARNGGVVYTVSANELAITSGDRVLAREPMVAYQARP